MATSPHALHVAAALVVASTSSFMASARELSGKSKPASKPAPKPASKPGRAGNYASYNSGGGYYSYGDGYDYGYDYGGGSK